MMIGLQYLATRVVLSRYGTQDMVVGPASQDG